jgi:hypothetical protein
MQVTSRPGNVSRLKSVARRFTGVR